MDLFPNEVQALVAVRQSTMALRALLERTSLPLEGDVERHFLLATAVKATLGQHANQVSALSVMLARGYLEAKFDVPPFDACRAHQNASGHDVVCLTRTGRTVIGEVKATVPSQGVKLGAVQVKNFRKDFGKLSATQADLKFFFVVDEHAAVAAHSLLRAGSYDPVIQVVNLRSAGEV